MVNGYHVTLNEKQTCETWTLTRLPQLEKVGPMCQMDKFSPSIHLDDNIHLTRGSTFSSWESRVSVHASCVGFSLGVTW